MDLNVIAASKRHNFLRVVYRIEMPATPAPPMSPISNYNASPEDRSVEALSTPIDDASPPSRRTSKFQELATHLNRSRSRNKVRGKGKTRTKYKIYRRQESLLTLLFIVPEFKSMYFIFLAGFLLFFTSIVADDFMNKDDIDFSMSLVKWNFQHYNQMFTTWLYMVLYTFVIVILFHIYRHDMYIFRIIQQHPKLRLGDRRGKGKEVSDTRRNQQIQRGQGLPRRHRQKGRSHQRRQGYDRTANR